MATLSRRGRAVRPGRGRVVLDRHPAEEAAIILRIGDHPGRYVLHCHNLDHEDMAMMADFDVGT
ncbi:multicopper oxidase domain-containing protein [Pseudonocardia sp. WMMC193]|uniref:multicopper oxidase domain-containing protein n=1 Tax=Pseudonocardia sp. WMMC193 TaxID=2911965 RepID=UPI001F23B6F8|nr:multicopper oxidase domain-containing protein [Pseudonocardia sp. WMMC193]MCF7547502.1 multicopper oxidase domain-containing protein [Pseudonocardia sp. WMMC193]